MRFPVNTGFAEGEGQPGSVRTLTTLMCAAVCIRLSPLWGGARQGGRLSNLGTVMLQYGWFRYDSDLEAFSLCPTGSLIKHVHQGS